MSDVKQNGKAGNNATLLQVGTVMIQSGMTAQEVISVAQRIWEMNLPRLEEKAREIASQRVHDLVEEIVSQSIKNHLDDFGPLSSPRKQNDLLQAERGFAFSDANENLKKVLADLVVSTLKESEEFSIRSVTFSEAISIASKLTKKQMMFLSTAYFFEFLIVNADSLDGLIETFEKYLDYLGVLEEKVESADILHLEYTGCLVFFQLRMGSFANKIKNSYSGLFSKGISKKILELKFTEGVPKNAFIPCLNDSSKFQVRALNENIINQHNEWTVSQKKILTELLNENLMSDSEIEILLKEKSQKVAQFIEKWDKTELGIIRETSVGRVIAHTYLTNSTDVKCELVL